MSAGWIIRVNFLLMAFVITILLIKGGRENSSATDFLKILFGAHQVEQTSTDSKASQ